MPRSTKGPRARGQGASTAEIVEAIEDDIIVGRLMPRERLIEEELMARFGVSRHIVRQALGELERMNIVDHIPNRGAMVRSYTGDEVLQLFELRDVLEAHAVTLMKLPATPAEIAALNAILNRYDVAAQNDDLASVYRENMAFHRAMFSLSGNKFLTEAIMDSATRTHAVRHQWLSQPMYLERASVQHRAMVAALASDDREGLIKMCHDHIAPSREMYIRMAAAKRTS